MTDTTAQIAAKGCQSTGITEDLAIKLHNQLGKKVIAVVELVSEARSEKRDGKEKVVLSILTIEPAPNTDTENHLRELARSFHYERKLADGQLQIDGAEDLEPKVTDVLAAGAKHLPHEFLVDQFDEGDCEVCGKESDDQLHVDFADDQVDEDPVEDDDQPDASDEEPETDPDPDAEPKDDEPLISNVAQFSSR